MSKRRQAEDSEQDGRNERRVRWATVFAMIIDAAVRAAQIIICH
jgi:hypothetical protein